MLDTSVRLLRLLTLLQVRRAWSGAELAYRLGVTTRTVRNDVERLRILGYEVHSSTGITGGYRLAAGSALPPLLLDDDEAVAVALGLRAAAAGSVTGIEETSLRALANLERTLPARLRHRVDALRQATVSAAGGGPTVDAETLTALAAACRDHEVLRFDYTGHDGEVSPRRVEPHRLVYTGRRWYLLAWDRDRADWRTFRADRIAAPTDTTPSIPALGDPPRLPAGPRFTPREPPEDVARYVVRGTASLGWPFPARVRLHAPAEVIADHERVTPAAGLLTPVDERSCILETGSGSLQDLVGYLTGLDVDFEVLDPPELRDLLRGLAARYSAAAGAARHDDRRPAASAKGIPPTTTESRVSEGRLGPTAT
jgi:predicted DNA-binding transcriptional regulator YafY